MLGLERFLQSNDYPASEIILTATYLLIRPASFPAGCFWHVLFPSSQFFFISFDGKSTAEFNADICLFLEQWEEERSELRAYNSTQAAYKRWKEQTLAYYAANAVKCTEPEELDRDELIARRTELLEKEYGKNESN